MSGEPVIKALTYRLYPSVAAQEELLRLRAIGCWLWNACLQQRIEAWQRVTLDHVGPAGRRKGATLSGVDQSREITELKEACDADPTLGVPWRGGVINVGDCPRAMLTDVAGKSGRLDKAFSAFFRRVKAGQTPGFPKFKSLRRFTSIGIQYGHGVRLQDTGEGMTSLVVAWGRGASARRVDVRCYLHRPIQGRPKHAVIEERADGWHLILQCDEVEPAREASTGQSVGVDVGLTTFAALSTGELIGNPRHAERAAKRLQRAQRKASRTVRTMQRLREAETGKKCDGKTAWRLVKAGRLSRPSDFTKPEHATGHRGSRRLRRKHDRVARVNLHIANQRKDFHHKTARDLVRRFDHISVEGLNLQGLVRSKLARPIADAGWGQFLALLDAKATEAGKEVVQVDPRGTSQKCSRCGEVVPKSLAVRVHRCHKCHLRLDRDVNAACNIAARGAAQGSPAQPGRRADGPLLDVEGKGCKRPLRSVNAQTKIQHASTGGSDSTPRRGRKPKVAHPAGVLDLPLWKHATGKV